jgi:hypothetical protein
MLTFGMTTPATAPHRSEIPERLTNYPVYKINFKGGVSAFPYANTGLWKVNWIFTDSLWVQHVSAGSHVMEDNAMVRRIEGAISQSQFKSGRKKQNVNSDTSRALTDVYALSPHAANSLVFRKQFCVSRKCVLSVLLMQEPITHYCLSWTNSKRLL